MPVPTDTPAQPGDLVTVVLHGWAHGGEAVGRLPDGITCFVGYAIPGETVSARITERRKRWARAITVEVLEASPHRVDPPCPHFGPDACGGCQLQHIAPDHQRELKAQVLTDALTRIGKLADPPAVTVDAPVGGWPARYRSWARMATTTDGALGFRRHASHDVEPIDECLLLDPAAQHLRRAAGDGWSGAEEVSLMAGSEGSTLTVTPGPDGVGGAPPGDFGVALRGAQGAPAVLRQPGEVTMTVHGTPLRVSAGAFFQAGPPAAEALVGLVIAAARVGPGDHVADLYGGVGLFASFLAAEGAKVTLIESNATAIADAHHNLAGTATEIIRGRVDTALHELDHVDVVVLDPPRSGAGKDVCRALLDLKPRRVVYVACDPAALARDTAVLVAGGMRLREVRGLDLFGHTSHVEAVATFVPVAEQDEPAGPAGGTAA